ncbi:MAG: helix-turn-helix domain-containing protein [Gammaproteobacteria bacterium]|nr:helix-turn-helix domain-containing protein [Gammaproteobacteria bacterium]
MNDLKISCSQCSLGDICIPRGLSKTEVKTLSDVVKQKTILYQNEYIYRQGDKFKGIFAIQTGMAKLVTIDPNGDEHILSILLPGELLGFDGLGDTHSCSAIALNTINVCELPRNRIEQACHKVPNLTYELFRHSSDILNDTQTHLVTAKLSGEQKIAKFMLDLSNRLQARGFSKSEFRLPLTRNEIGNHLGLAIETVSRLLKQLQQKKLLDIQLREVTILDYDGLMQIAHKDSNEEV